MSFACVPNLYILFIYLDIFFPTIHKNPHKKESVHVHNDKWKRLKYMDLILTSNLSATRSMRRTFSDTCLGRTFPWTTVIATTFTSGEHNAMNSAWASSIPASQSIKIDFAIFFRSVKFKVRNMVMCWLIFIGLLFFHIDTDILAIFKQRLTRHNEMIIYHNQLPKLTEVNEKLTCTKQDCTCKIYLPVRFVHSSI